MSSASWPAPALPVELKLAMVVLMTLKILGWSFKPLTKMHKYDPLKPNKETFK